MTIPLDTRPSTPRRRFSAPVALDWTHDTASAPDDEPLQLSHPDSDPDPKFESRARLFRPPVRAATMPVGDDPTSTSSFRPPNAIKRFFSFRTSSASHTIPSHPPRIPASVSGSTLTSHGTAPPYLTPPQPPPLTTEPESMMYRRRSSDGRLSSDAQTTGDAPISRAQARASALPPKAGEALLKVTTRKVRQRWFRFRLDAVAGEMTWASKKSNRVTLASLVGVRSGAAAAADRQALSISAAHEPRWITVSYRAFARPGDPPADKLLHLIALSDQSFERWRRALQLLVLAKHALLGPTPAPSLTAPTSLSPALLLLPPTTPPPPHAALLAPPPAPGDRLDLAATVRLCRQLGIHAPGPTLANLFTQADTLRSGTLDFTQFQVFVRLLTRRPEIDTIFSAWCARQPETQPAGMTQETFGQFLHLEQKMTLTGDALSKLFRRYAHVETGLLGLEGFTNFLLSADNCAIADRFAPAALPSIQAQTHVDAQRLSAHTPEELLALSAPGAESNQATSNPPPNSKSAQTSTPTALKRPVANDVPDTACAHDMNRPLNEYFIAASHNTYLVSGQLVGDSGVEGLVRALQAGARSIELDCWDGPHGEPMVTHGRTLTTRLGFRDAVRAISKYAFAASPWPLILCLEVHNTVAQQDVLASTLVAELGPALLTQRLPHSIHAPHLPSPRELQGRILIKAKDVTAVPIPLGENIKVEDLTQPLTQVWTASSSEGCSASDDTASDDSLGHRLTRRLRPSSSPSSKPSKRALSPRLKELLVYTVGVKYRGFLGMQYPSEHMISFSEAGAKKLLHSDDPRGKGTDEDSGCKALASHAHTHLVRIYPSLMSNVTRGKHTSANPDPLAFWMSGCQQAALNWQTNDLGLELSHAMFARNAAAGWVLKPVALRDSDPGPTTNGNATAKARVRMNVRIISAQLLPRPSTGTGAENDDSALLSPSISLALYAPPQWGDQPGSCTNERSRGHSRLSRLYLKKPNEAVNSALGKLTPNSWDVPLSRTRSGSSSQAESPHRSTSSLSGRSWTSDDGQRKRENATSTTVVQRNGFNPRWEEDLGLTLDVPVAPDGLLAPHSSGASAADLQRITGGLLDLAFVRFQVWSHPDPGPSDPPHLPAPTAHERVASSPSTPTPSEENLGSTGDAHSPKGNPKLVGSKSDYPPRSPSAGSSHLKQRPVCPTRTRTTPLRALLPPTPHLIRRQSVSGTADEMNDMLDRYSTSPDPTPSPPPSGGTSKTTRQTTTTLAAAHMASVGRLAEGYHHLPLYDAHLNPLPHATIFVHVRFQLDAIMGPTTSLTKSKWGVSPRRTSCAPSEGVQTTASALAQASLHPSAPPPLPPHSDASRQVLARTHAASPCTDPVDQGATHTESLSPGSVSPTSTASHMSFGSASPLTLAPSLARHPDPAVRSTDDGSMDHLGLAQLDHTKHPDVQSDLAYDEHLASESHWSLSTTQSSSSAF